MEKKYQVFISSTFNDLKEERVEIMEALINLGHIPIGMELFNAADDTQWGVIKRRIEESDYYVLILSDRYGSLDADGVGFTEKEYDYAIDKEIPVISFVRSDDSVKELPFELRESDNRTKLDNFRKKVSSRLYKPWGEKHDLSKKFFLAFAELISDKPRNGWVRSGSVEGVSKAQFDNIFNDNSTLKEQNNSLSIEVAELKKKVSIYEDLSLKVEKITRSLKSNFYLIEGIELSGWRIVGIFGSFLAVETTVNNAASGIQSYMKSLTGESVNRDLMKNIIGIFSGFGLIENRLESHKLHEEDSHKGDSRSRDTVEIIEYIKPTALFVEIYPLIEEKNIDGIFSSLTKTNVSVLRKRLSELGDFNFYTSDPGEYEVKKNSRIEMVINEFISKYEWDSDSEKESFLSMDFMNSNYALSELFAKANMVVDRIEKEQSNIQA